MTKQILTIEESSGREFLAPEHREQNDFFGPLLLGASLGWVAASIFYERRAARSQPGTTTGRVLWPRDRRSDRPFSDFSAAPSDPSAGATISAMEDAMENEGGAVHSIPLDPLTDARMTDHNARGGYSEKSPKR